MKSIKNKAFFITAPLLFSAFMCAVFFQGLTDFWFAPALLAILLFGVLGFFEFITGNRSFPISVTIGFLVLWWGFMGASLFSSQVPFNSLVFFFIMGSLPFLTMVLLCVNDPGAWIRTHVAILFIAVLGLAFWALIQFYVWPEIYGPRIRHPFRNPNTLGGIFVLTVLPLTGIFLKAKESPNRWIILGATILVFAALLVTQSRGAFLGGVIALPPLLFAARGHTGFKRNCLALGGAALLVFFLFHFSGGERLAPRLVQIGTFNDANTIGARLDLWAATWEMIKIHPWFGTGLGTFYLIYPKFRLVSETFSSGLWAHNDPLQLWSELGVFGLFLFYALLCSVLGRTICAWRRTTDPLGMIMPFSGLLAMVFHSHFTFHLYQPAILMIAAGLLAWWYHETEDILGKKRKPLKKSHTIVVLAFIGVIVFSAMWVSRAGLGVYWSGQARVALHSGDFEYFSRTVQHLHAAAPGSYYQTYLYMAEAHSSMVRISEIPLTPKERETHAELAFVAIDRGETLNPLEPMFKHSRANLLLALGDRDAAKEIWRKTLSMNPQHFESRMALAKMLEEAGSLRQALALLEEGLVWRYYKNPAAYYLYTARLRLQLGDVSGHLDLMTKAKQSLSR